MDRGSLVIGKILQLTESGQAIVDWDGNSAGPTPARSALGPELPGDAARATVVLAFAGGDERRPVILGFVHDELFAPTPARAAGTSGTSPAELRLEAREAIELRCGESSLSMDRAGRIRLKGTQIVSRSSGVQRIKGATVEIN